jgi:hypothetical protein
VLLTEKVALLESVKANEYVLEEGQTATTILEIALSELGNTDGYIRDELALETAAYMIYKDYLSTSELKQLAKRLASDEFLLYGLEDRVENSPFKRTFTALIIAMLFRIPNKKIVLNDTELNALYSSFLTYLKGEYDYRGYIEGQGWLHFFAHVSDVMKYFFNEPTFDNSWVEEYLNVVLDIIHTKQYVFAHNEEERFMNAFMVLLDRDDISELLISSFLDRLIQYPRTKQFPEDLQVYVNVKHVLATLYFAVIDKEDYVHIANHIKRLIQSLTIN